MLLILTRDKLERTNLISSRKNLAREICFVRLARPVRRQSSQRRAGRLEELLGVFGFGAITLRGGGWSSGIQPGRFVYPSMHSGPTRRIRRPMHGSANWLHSIFAPDDLHGFRSEGRFWMVLVGHLATLHQHDAVGGIKHLGVVVHDLDNRQSAFRLQQHDEVNDRSGLAGSHRGQQFVEQ